MSFLERAQREWHVVEGHAKWDLYKFTGAAVLALGAYLVHRLKYGPDWLPYAVAFVLALFVFFWMGSNLTVSSSAIQRTEPIQKTTLSPNDPDLRAEIQEVLFHFKRNLLSNDIFVLMRVGVVNHGEGEAVVTKWELTSEVDGAQMQFEEQDVPAEWLTALEQARPVRREPVLPPTS